MRPTGSLCARWPSRTTRPRRPWLVRRVGNAMLGKGRRRVVSPGTPNGKGRDRGLERIGLSLLMLALTPLANVPSKGRAGVGTVTITSGAMAQEPPTGQQRPFTLQVDVGMVFLHATVVDGRGRLVSSLQKQNFKVLDDGAPQELSLFQREDVPVAVGLVVDSSGSMANKRDQAVAASLAFARSSN